MPKSPEEKLAELQKRQSQLKAQIQKEQAKLRNEERKRDTRRKIIAGALALEHARRDPDWKAKLETLLAEYVERDEDRALFGL